ncbi:pro-resilin-like isoform X2 [Eriocheir sinensis]|uniref:pro-resilin-like isoform X2 n=1 Tax=Eriocheir sinensis TaxID=95602 RepID=UPI0021C7DB24|nr:pro-resilin-like isoform X2 [Eriocheir sinensis]
MNAKVLLLLALSAAAASADDSGSRERSYGRYGDSESYESGEAKYDFSYQVKDYYGNDFGHRESREDEYTQGFYYNHLPDGRLQKVTYYVDGDSGYVADVSYEGEARYDSDSRESGESYYGRGFRGSDSNESK